MSQQFNKAKNERFKELSFRHVKAFRKTWSRANKVRAVFVSTAMQVMECRGMIPTYGDKNAARGSNVP